MGGGGGGGGGVEGRGREAEAHSVDEQVLGIPPCSSSVATVYRIVPSVLCGWSLGCDDGAGKEEKG